MPSSQQERAGHAPVQPAAPPACVVGFSRPGPVPRLTRRVRPLVAELGKFVVVGVGCTLLDVAVANALHVGLGVGPTLSKTASTVLATLVAYLGNRAWAFAHRVDARASHGRDLGMFMAVNVIGLVITLVPVDVGHYLLGLTSPLAFNVTGLLGTVVATAFRFWAYRRLVFIREPSPVRR